MKNRVKNRVKKQALSFAAVMAMVLGGGMQLYAADKIADTVYRNGKIYTITEKAEEAKDAKNAKKVDVVATLNGKIVFVGSEADAKSQGYLDENKVNKIVDLRGKTMLPGFVDGHGHFPQQGNCDLYQVNLNSYPLGEMTCIADYVAALQKQSDLIGDNDTLIIGYGYDDTLIEEMVHPTKEDLDSIPNPVIIKHISGHMLVANSRALKELGTKGDILETPDLWKTAGVVLGDDGKPTGLLRETAAMSLINSATKTDSQKAVSRASQVYAAAGVTTSDGGTSMLYADIPLFQRGMLRDELGVRVVFHPIGYLSANPASGSMNRSSLGWTGADYLDGTNAVKIGTDISDLHLSVSGYPLESMETQLNSKYSDIADQVASLNGKNMVFLGAWKLMCDGSPQGYTGWMKYPGYYTLGEFEQAEEDRGGEFSEQNYYSGRSVGGNDLLNTKPEDIPTAIEIYHKYGQSTEMHLNGNASGEAWIAGMEKVLAKNAYDHIKDTRHTVIHAQFLERQQIQRQMGLYDQLTNKAENEKMYVELEGTMKSGIPSMEFLGGDPAYTDDINVLADRMKKQNIFNSYFTTHTYFYGDRHKNIFFGPGRANQISPAQYSVDYGQKFSFHNDTMVTPISPLQSIASGVTRVTAKSKMWEGGTIISGSSKDPSATVELEARKGKGVMQTYWDYDQRLNVLQAIHAVTAMPAWQNKLEGKIGSIREGLFADFTILDEDPFVVAETDPEKIASIRVTTTVVGDKPIHGFLPDAESFLGKPLASYVQPNDQVVVTVTSHTAIDNKQAEKDYIVPMKDAQRLGTYSFNATVDGGDTAVFQMSFLGNGATVESMNLFRLVSSTESEEYTYSEQGEKTDGSWWIAPLSDPTHPLAPTATLNADESYLAFFVITDNGGFDSDIDAGKIATPITLMTSESLPTNGNTEVDDDGSSSGCTVGSTPSYDLLVLFLGMSAVAAIRVLRRRNEQ